MPSAMAPLWTADARGGVVRIGPGGEQEIITQKISGHFEGVAGEASRYLEGTLPNGLAFARNGDILISNFGTDRLEVMTRTGESKVLADAIDGQPIGKVNFVLRDSKDRIWITISTRIKNWMHALRPDLADGYIARYVDGSSALLPAASTSPMRSGWMPKRSISTWRRQPAVASAACAFTTTCSLGDSEVFGPSNLGRGAWPGRYRLR